MKDTKEKNTGEQFVDYLASDSEDVKKLYEIIEYGEKDEKDVENSLKIFLGKKYEQIMEDLKEKLSKNRSKVNNCLIN